CIIKDVMIHEMGGELGDEHAVSLSDNQFDFAVGTSQLPNLILRAGDHAARRFVEFFTATIRNRNTRAAYAQAVGQFCQWCYRQRIELSAIRPVIIAAYLEELTA